MFSRILPTVVAIHGNGYDSQHYNFFAIIFVGYKVISERAVQFRKWATGVYATSIDYDVTAEISQAGKYCT